jgi:hypothetical protein
MAGHPRWVWGDKLSETWRKLQHLQIPLPTEWEGFVLHASQGSTKDVLMQFLGNAATGDPGRRLGFWGQRTSAKEHGVHILGRLLHLKYVPKSRMKSALPLLAYGGHIFTGQRQGPPKKKGITQSIILATVPPTTVGTPPTAVQHTTPNIVIDAQAKMHWL